MFSINTKSQLVFGMYENSITPVFQSVLPDADYWVLPVVQIETENMGVVQNLTNEVVYIDPNDDFLFSMMIF